MQVVVVIVDTLFLSTLSLRRATVKSFMRNGFFLISIHALLAESDALDDIKKG